MDTPKLKCMRCHGRGFYLKAGGFTKADHIPCHKCNGIGLVDKYRDKSKKPKEYKYQ